MWNTLYKFKVDNMEELPIIHLGFRIPQIYQGNSPTWTMKTGNLCNSSKKRFTTSELSQRKLRGIEGNKDEHL